MSSKGRSRAKGVLGTLQPCGSTWRLAGDGLIGTVFGPVPLSGLSKERLGRASAIHRLRFHSVCGTLAGPCRNCRPGQAGKVSQVYFQNSISQSEY